MKGTMTIIKVDGSAELIELDRKPDLVDLQETVGGYIEIVPMFETFGGRECVCFCNEEGKLDGLPVNIVATQHWVNQTGPIDDFLVGNVVICQGDDEFMEAL
jgi:hypothetical protein